MIGLVKIKCHFCHKQFHKEKRHFNWSRKLGHNSFCSKKCEAEYRLNGKWLVCENNNCKKRFYRNLAGISPFNYCSGSCAAIVNNQKYPKWPKRYCTICKKEFKNRDSKYCSTKCGYVATSNYRSGKAKYTQEQIISVIKDFYQQHQRAPAKREVLEIVGCATHKFGSWNSSVIAAGLEPHRSHDNRMYKRTRTKANDGHVCDSVSEALVDNWLTQNHIPHTRDAQYPTTNHRADWSTKNGKIFIEYFGLAKDSPRYDRAVKEKIKLCRKNKIKLIGIYPKDLYPNNQLGKVLSKLI